MVDQSTWSIKGNMIVYLTENTDFPYLVIASRFNEKNS